jgi:hypothetical protein
MAILLWLLPPVLVTCAAMAWAAWAGRGRPALNERSEAAQARAQERFAEALARPLPGGQAMGPGTGRPARRTGGPSTGVAFRRTGRRNLPSR